VVPDTRRTSSSSASTTATPPQLAEAAGLSDRVTRRLVDIAATPEAVEPADIVILHRVVCCYPDYERLLSAAAGHADTCWCSATRPATW
jgi:magnesium-protoporphyrin O-methyltransferase